ETRPRHAAHPDQCAVAERSQDRAPQIQTVQDGHKKACQCPAAMFPILHSKGANIRWVVAHATADEPCCVNPFLALQMSNAEWSILRHLDSPELRMKRIKSADQTASSGCTTIWSRSQCCVRPSNEKPINPRTFNVWPPSSRAMEHR